MAKHLIALTGKTGAGKSTVSEILKSKGAYIIDGDVVAREVLTLSPELKLKLQSAFGDDVYSENTLNRALLAKRAFSSQENTALLNSIFHPVINKRLFELSKEAFLNCDIVIVDAAAVIESGFYKKCDLLITVTAPEDIRLERIMKRDSISREAALLRMNAQQPDSFYIEKSDYVIKNYSPHNLTEQVNSILKEIDG